MLNTTKIEKDEKIPNLKLMIVSEYQHTKTFLLKDILKIDRKKFLLLTKLKTLFRGLILLVTYMVNQLLKVFMKKELQKPSQENEPITESFYEKRIAKT